MNIILIPTYNERANIAALISQIRSLHQGIMFMVIDDNSPDGTAEEVETVMKSDPLVTLLQREKKEGLGRAYIDALERVRMMPDIEHVITMDGDWSHDPIYISDLLEKAGSCDLVVGSRYVAGGGVDNWGWHRRLLSHWGNIYSAFILGVKVKDLTAGFVCFRRVVLDRIDFTRFASAGYSYQIEFKYYCIRAGFTCAEVPIIFKERAVGKSKMSPSIVLGGIITPVRLRLSGIFRK